MTDESQNLHGALAAKAVEFDRIVKSGRTHLMDSTPIRRPVRELAAEMTDLTPAQIAQALDPRRQTEPGLTGETAGG